MTRKMNSLTSTRAKAWHNVMVAAINHALNENLLDLNPDYDYLKWPDFTPGSHYPNRPTVEFEIEVLDERMAVAMSDAGHHEVFFTISGIDLVASGWLERKTKPELQVNETISKRAFSTSREFTSRAAALDFERKGYGLGVLRM